MLKRECQGNQHHPKSLRQSGVVDSYDEERGAQREEFLRREREQKQSTQLQILQNKPKKQKKSKAKPPTFDEKLEATERWLEETFPHLFATDDYVLLDPLILQDIKNHYKNNGVKMRYPEDLVIKAALNRYRESSGYLSCIQKGVQRYNMKGEVCGVVTTEEEEKALDLLEEMEEI